MTPTCILWKSEELINKSPEQRLNLSRSRHKDLSRTYNTPFFFKSYTKDLSFRIFEIILMRRLKYGFIRPQCRYNNMV